jgi:hypothetical protein
MKRSHHTDIGVVHWRPNKPYYRGITWNKLAGVWVAQFTANGQNGKKLVRPFRRYEDAVLQRQAWVEQFRVQGYATY